jgi:hypothetical protein
VQLTDLLNHVSRLWTPPAKVPGRKVMVIPFIRDIDNGLQAGTVAAQCAACAMQLAPHLYVWRRPFPQQPTLKELGYRKPELPRDGSGPVSGVSNAEFRADHCGF